MTYRSIWIAFTVVIVITCSGCNSFSGRPGAYSRVIPPDQILDFKVLYAQNCAGCHGPDGKGGGAIALSDPVFLAIADDDVVRRTATYGVTGTPMPAFSQKAGGMLTDRQIDAIVSGIRSWGVAGTFQDTDLPPYAAQAGDPHRGSEVYVTYCSSCHGPAGRGGSEAGSIVDGSYLALVSDQNLRTIVITGRHELGAPDWRNNVPGRPMSSQDISDVVAWLAAQRPQFPGQPYPSPAEGFATRTIP
jgi:mono/diheme cytochrome c family protein